MHEYNFSDKIRNIPPPCKGTLRVWPPSRRTNWCSHFFGRVLTCQNCPALTKMADFDKKCPKTLRLLSHHSLCMILFVISNQKICFIFGQIMSHLLIKPQRNKKGRNFFETPTKNYIFFTAGSWEKDIIFSGHLKQISALLVLSELY